jgi:hypothetical protein
MNKPGGRAWYLGWPEVNPQIPARGPLVAAVGYQATDRKARMQRNQQYQWPNESIIQHKHNTWGPARDCKTGSLDRTTTLRKYGGWGDSWWWNRFLATDFRHHNCSYLKRVCWDPQSLNIYLKRPYYDWRRAYHNTGTVGSIGSPRK